MASFVSQGRNIRGSYRAARYRLSKMLTSKHTPAVAHVRLADFDMLVFRNEVVGRLIYLFNEFEPLETSFFKAAIQDGDVCFDIGANLGYFSMLFSRCAEHGKVYAFEPIPLNAKIVQVNALLNGIDNVEVICSAVGNGAGDVSFSLSSDSAFSSMKNTGRSPEARQLTVCQITIDDFLVTRAIDRVDLMKVDVEGAELLVVQGAQGLFKDPSRRPRIVMLELYSGNLGAFGSTVKEVIWEMQKFGYEPHVLNPEAKLRPLMGVDIDVIENIFFLDGSSTAMSPLLAN